MKKNDFEITAKALVKAVKPHLAAEYTANMPLGSKPATEEIFTIKPP